jgi:hypothetical protein
VRRRVRFSKTLGSRLIRLAALLAFMAPPSAETAADEVMVPPNVQAAAVVRILEYDRGLKTWVGTSLIVGVVAKDSRGGAAAEFTKSLAGREVQGMPVKVVDHTYKDGEALGGWIEQNGIRLVYVAPDLSNHTAAVLSAGSARKVPTFTPTREQFQGGATLGLVVHEGRPRVLVNLPACKSAGMNLDPKLLELSEVTR